jgi:hypothetical protein
MTSSLNENSCQLVSSRGILKSCDINSRTPFSSIPHLVNYDFTQLKPNCTFYVSTSAIGILPEIIESIISDPFILVSGDADESTPVDIFAHEQDFLRFIESPKIIHWFGQNGVVQHPKFSQIPIGLDYHTMSQGQTFWGPQLTPPQQEAMITKIKNEALPLSRRILKAHANFHFLMTTKYGMDRVRAKELIPSDLVDYETCRVDRETTWRNQSQYAFVISPHGNGLDCHRTWEALCLGCIPIVRTSPLDSLYEGLPVYIVKDWSDVTEENLKRVLSDFSQRKFDLNRLTLKYWIDKINSKKIS